MKLDNYLDNIDKTDSLTEVVDGGAAFILAAIFIVKFVVIMSRYIKMFKVAGIPNARRDEYLEKKLEEIVKEKVSIGEYRNPTPNACAYPNGKMYYASGIKDILTEPELIAIMLHEFGHIKEKHSRKRIWGTESVGLGVELLFCALALIPGFVFLAGIYGFVFGLIIKGLHMKRVIKRTELEADSYAKKYGYGKELASALKKIEAWIHDMLKRTWKDATPEQIKEATDTIQKSAGYPTFKERIEKVLNFAPIKKMVENGAVGSMSMIGTIVKKTKLFDNLGKK